MSHEPFDISSYLLGELSPDERRAAEDRLRDDPALRAEVDRLRPVVGGLDKLPDEAWNPPEPPAVTVPERPRRLVVRPALALAACLAVAVVVAVALTSGDGDSGDPVRLAPLGKYAGDAEGSYHDGRLKLAVDGVAPSRAGEFYELWLLGDDGELLSLGSFRIPRSGAAEISVPVPGNPSRYRFLDVSLERDDGNPAHSKRSVLRGSTSS